MIKEQEIRIGNLFYYNPECWNYIGHQGNFIWSDRDWYAYGESTLFLEDIEPIPLTKEWLVDKLGAIEHTGTPFWNIEMPRNIGFISINPNNNMIWLKHHRTDSSLNPGSIYFVHQLQNLYFALVGEELTIK